MSQTVTRKNDINHQKQNNQASPRGRSGVCLTAYSVTALLGAGAFLAFAVHNNGIAKDHHQDRIKEYSKTFSLKQDDPELKLKL
jgi:hypothetical protein